MTVYQKHMAAIERGEIDKTTVIGLKKLVNMDWRRARGYSISSTAPKASPQEVEALQIAMRERAPAVVGELHESGVKVLRSDRFRRQLRDVADLVEEGPILFRLVGFADIGRGHFLPIYQVETRRGSFRFQHVPWQASFTGAEPGPIVWEVRR